MVEQLPFVAVVHEPLLHVVPPVQIFPHVPQLFMSVMRS